MSSALFTEAEVLERDWFGRVHRFVGLETTRQRIGFAAAILVPLLVFACVTSAEQRFLLGSLRQEAVIAGHRGAIDILGMSFAGDPMVWGFTLLVPCLIAVVGLAARRTVRLVNTAAARSSRAWVDDKGEYGRNRAAQHARAIWAMTAWGVVPRRALHCCPWVLAILFWWYNAVTCGGLMVHIPPLPDFPHYPYLSDSVSIVWKSPPTKTSFNSLPSGPIRLAEETRLRVQPREIVPEVSHATVVTLRAPLPLAKWDCDPEHYPASFVLARIWTLFYYGAIPFLLREVLLMVWGATVFLGAGRRWELEHGNGEPALAINPFESDEFGGLSPLADAAIIYCYCVSIPTALLGLAFFKEGIAPQWHDYFLMYLYLPLGLLLVFAPVFAVHEAIVSAKDKKERKIAEALDKASDELLILVQRGAPADERKCVDDDRQALGRLLTDIKLMKEWPFNWTSAGRLALSAATPWLPAVLKEMSSALLGG